MGKNGELNKIEIKPHYCTDEEYQELKDYLTENDWDWQEISSGTVEHSQEPTENQENSHISKILMHDIKWFLSSDEDGTYLTELPETAEEHISYMITQGFLSGELLQDIYPEDGVGRLIQKRPKDQEPISYSGWWSIQK